ncbi:MAG: hypothetical protein V1924_02065 [Candidatus Bathyarchaeota archaeon]
MDASEDHPNVKVIHINEEEQLMFTKLFLEEADAGIQVVSVKSAGEPTRISPSSA